MKEGGGRWNDGGNHAGVAPGALAGYPTGLSDSPAQLPEKPATRPEAQPASWLVRLPEVFADFSGEIIRGLGGELLRKMGQEYYLLRVADPVAFRESEASIFIRWKLPVEHAWPCNPEKMEGFIEKAARTVQQKFAGRKPQSIFMGLTDPGAPNRYYKTLGSNLRGRTLQLFPAEVAALKDVEEQDPARPALFCMIGKEGLFCGMQSPRDSNGFYPGGTKYISQSSADTISRAGAKIAEALHYLRLHRNPPKKGSHWLELGASPGGMTSELLNRGYRVTAIDRAELDKRLDGREGLHFAKMDVAAFMPNQRMTYDAIVSDMNGDALESIRQVARLSANLNPGGLVIFTLKTPGTVTYEETLALHAGALKIAESAGLRRIVTTHLTYNRQEFTMVFGK